MTESPIVSPQQASRYLRASGWTLAREGDASSVFVRPIGDDILRLILPKEDGPRWMSSFESVTNTLSKVEKKSIKNVIVAIRSVGFDIIRSKLPDCMVEHDSVEIDVALNYIASSKRLLASSATAELNPSQYNGKPVKDAKSYARRCRFGHTFRGSFGFTIESPIPEDDQHSFTVIEPEVPFERRVIRRLAVGLMDVSEAVRKEDIKILTSRYETGFNANMCEQMISLFGAAKNSSITFEFSWSPEWKEDRKLYDNTRFVITEPAIDVVRDAANKLRVIEKGQEVYIYGLVTDLHSQTKPTDDFGGVREITIQWFNQDRKKLNVHMELTQDQYLEAWQAHHDGRAIAANGILMKKGKYWYLAKFRGFKVI